MEGGILMQQRFRASINLQFDLSDPLLLNRYILSASHAEVLSGILDGALQGGSQAHLLIGPYGTGKSLLATIGSQLLSKRFDQDWALRLRKQAEALDQALARKLQAAALQPITYIPVAINGRSGSFRGIINQAVHRTLHQAGIALVSPNEASAIHDTVARWRDSYPDTYAAFIAFLDKQSVNETEFLDQIALLDEQQVRRFSAFYPTVTAGMPWQYAQENHFIEQLEHISAELRTHDKGLFIVYDEFGRFLQSLDAADSMPNMQDLQEFAEFVNRTDNVHVLLIGHKHIRQYAAASREHIRMEFEKVEKRFRFYTLDNDPATFLQLAQEAAREVNQVTLARVPELLTIERLQEFPLFAEYSAYQLEHGILQGLYPLHPVAAVLLPQLSNTFGQNERTLFSFMSDMDRDSLPDHADHMQGYYYADKLFSFFRVDEADYQDIPSLQVYHRIVAALDARAETSKRVVSLLTLWAAVRMAQKQPMTTAFLTFALGLSISEADQVLMELQTIKMVRYNAIRHQWELFEGSSIDLEAEIATRLQATSILAHESSEILEQHLPLAFVQPYEYNDDMDMLRFADIRFAFAKDLQAVRIPAVGADDRVWLLLYWDEEQKDDPDAFMAELGSPLLVAFPHFTMERILPDLKLYKLIDRMLMDTDLLSRDGRVKNELLFAQQEVSAQIRSFVEQYFQFSKLQWRSGTEVKHVGNLHELEQLVTERLWKTFDKTPIIRNESFNRNRISKVQRRAVIDVIDRLIHQPTTPNLGIEGYGPNYLIYVSSLKNNEYVFDEQGNVRCSDKMLELRRELLRIIERKPVGNVSDLVRLMEQKPYGIRAAVIPLLLVALLRDKWEQLLFFAHDMLIAHLSGSAVLELVERADQYEYRLFQWSLEERLQLQQVSGYFCSNDDEPEHLLQLAEVLLHWLRGLPKFAQISMQVSADSIVVRDLIRATEIDPYGSLKKLAAFGSQLLDVKAELEQFMSTNAAVLTRYLLEMTEYPDLHALFTCIRAMRHEAIGLNSRLLTLPDPGDDEAIEVITLHQVGVSRADWSDATQELFLNQLQYEWQVIRAGGEAAASQDEEEVLSVPLLSKKSQTLYANVKNMLKYAGRDVPVNEVRELLRLLLREI